MNVHVPLAVRCACVIGTRPEIIKMAPIVRRLQQAKWANCDLITTGQHNGLLSKALADFGLQPDFSIPYEPSQKSLAMLLANLLDNALRYTPEGGRIDVAIDDDGGRAVLAVIDTGPGIPAGDRARVFERFHRGTSASGADAPGGSGLGLSIVRRIADAHGATVALDDGPDGRGLAVRVRFPAANQS